MPLRIYRHFATFVHLRHLHTAFLFTDTVLRCHTPVGPVRVAVSPFDALPRSFVHRHCLPDAYHYITAGLPFWLLPRCTACTHYWLRVLPFAATTLRAGYYVTVDYCLTSHTALIYRYPSSRCRSAGLIRCVLPL